MTDRFAIGRPRPGAAALRVLALLSCCLALPATAEHRREPSSAPPVAQTQDLGRQGHSASPSPGSLRQDAGDARMIRRAQRELAQLGYNPGTPDGVMGKQSRRAIRQFQRDRGLHVDGQVTQDLMRELRTARKSGFHAPVTAQGSGGDSEKLQALLDDLGDLVGEARRRSSDRWLTRELRRLWLSYQGPWSHKLMGDDFRDGDYTHNPRWTVQEGVFEVDPRYGLLSAVGRHGWRELLAQARAGETDAAAPMFDRLIQKKRPGKRGPGRRHDAEIRQSLKVPASFGIEVELETFSDRGDFELGPDRDVGGRRGPEGYRLALHYGPDARIELIRLSGGQSEVLADRELSPGQLAERSQSLAWSRDDDGRMEVTLDGESVMKVRDSGRARSFDGLTMTNRGGYVAVRDVAVYGE